MFKPTTLAELSAAVRDSSGPLTPRGAGLHQGLGHPAHPESTIIDCTGINQVADYVASDLTITVGAGITLGALQDILAAHRQWLPWDAPQYRQATVAGLLAAGLSGPLRHGAGAPRDWLLGMQFVIDGRSFDMNRIDRTSVLGQVEQWEFVNGSSMDHPMHIHGTQFQVTETDSGSARAPVLVRSTLCIM